MHLGNANFPDEKDVKLNYPAWLNSFVYTYEKLSPDNLELLSRVYHREVHFIDPIHELHGFVQLHNYFEDMYTNITYCQFLIKDVIYQGNSAAVYWEMTFVHSTLNRKKPIKINGHSHIKGQGNKVIFHQDYLDLGAMIYEHIPLLGRVVCWLKQKISS